MLAWIYIALSIADVLIQGVAAYFAYKIYAYNRLSKIWLTVPLGFLLMAFRRVLTFSYAQGYLQSSVFNIRIIDSLFIPFVISILLVIGIWAMYNNFRSFTVVEKEVKRKVEKFTHAKKRKKPSSS